MVLPTSAIMYASGQSTDNSDDSSTGGSTTTDNSGSSSTGGGQLLLRLITVAHHQLVVGQLLLLLITVAHHQLVVGTTTTTTDNSATLPTTSTASNNTGNVLIHAMMLGGVLKAWYWLCTTENVLPVGVPPLVWNDTLAAGAKTWADIWRRLKSLSIKRPLHRLLGNQGRREP